MQAQPFVTIKDIKGTQRQKNVLKREYQLRKKDIITLKQSSALTNILYEDDFMQGMKLVFSYQPTNINYKPSTITVMINENNRQQICDILVEKFENDFYTEISKDGFKYGEYKTKKTKFYDKVGKEVEEKSVFFELSTEADKLKKRMRHLIKDVYAHS
ncbi:MAG: hypothetical protein LBV67_06275 [Streptococcaceae bacterium]|jgi:hypothetical protein|nr:hypothetical protein [Streptococcaceae bacterium]